MNHSDIMKASRKQEAGVAKRIGGVKQPRSGAGEWRKNDVRNDKYLFECKLTTAKKSITLKDVDLRDVATNAALEDRIGVLQFELNGRAYVVLQEFDFLELS